MGTGRALGQFPFVAEQVVKEVVTPLCRGCGPNDFQAAADRVARLTGAEFAPPAEPLFLNGGGFRLRTNIVCGASAVGFAEAVTACNQGNRLFVVHGHAAEGFANVPGCGDGIRVAIWPFRIHVDETHLHRAQRILKITVARVALVGQPLAFRAPVELFRFPDILAPAAKTEGLEAHRLEPDVARENHQVGPGDFPAVFLLDWPEQPARLVEVDVVGPAVEWRKALLAGSGSAAAVADAVRACAVPCHSDEQRTVVAKVGRPPLLRVRHQRVKIFDHAIQIEALEFFGVIELFAHRIGQRRVLMQDVQIQLIRPPVCIAVNLTSAMGYRALGLG